MREMLLLAALATSSAFTGSPPLSLRTGTMPANIQKFPASSPVARSSRTRKASLRMADPEDKESITSNGRSSESKHEDSGEVAQRVDSFTELVKRVTGKPDYKFGDLSRASFERLTETAEAAERGSINALSEITTILSSPDYEFGDLSRAGAKEVMEWGKGQRKSIEAITGKDYEFGDLTKHLANEAIARARSTLGPDYQFGDLTKAAAKAATEKLQNYKFGDISRGVAKFFHGKTKEAAQKRLKGLDVDEAKQQAALTQATRKLERLEMEKNLLAKILREGTAEGAEAAKMQELLVQEMGYLEYLAADTEKKNAEKKLKEDE